MYFMILLNKYREIILELNCYFHLETGEDLGRFFGGQIILFVAIIFFAFA